jgi:hypothetical protein
LELSPFSFWSYLGNSNIKKGGNSNLKKGDNSNIKKGGNSKIKKGDNSNIPLVFIGVISLF